MKKINTIIVSLLLCFNCMASYAVSEKLTNTDNIFTQQNIRKSINDIINVLKNDYIYPDKVTQIVLPLRQKLRINTEQYVNNRSLFIKELGSLLRKRSGDGQLDLLSVQDDFLLGDNASFQYQNNNTNFGFEQAKVLAGNIGYVKINHFFQNKAAEAVANQAFSLLTDTKVIIIDLRDASDGSMELAQYLMSYFVDTKTLFCQMSYQRQEEYHDLWSIEHVGIQPFKHNPTIYILTSSFSAGAIEFFSYTLKYLNKAIIVGEQTMGVANWTKVKHVNQWFSLDIPIAIPINPTTGTNWHDEGVTPDYQSSANSSFDLAYKLAQQAIK